MAEKVLYATYDDDHKLIEGAKKLVGEGVFIKDFSPRRHEDHEGLKAKVTPM